MPKATQLCFFGLALILMPLVVSYVSAQLDAKTVYRALTAEHQLAPTTLYATEAELLMATSVEVEDLTSGTPPIATTYINSGADVDFNQRITGLLSHVHWLIDRASLGGGRTNTSGGVDRVLFDKQIERSADNANDSIRDTRSDLNDDINDLDTRLASAESDLANLSIAAASTSVMAANLTLNGHWLSGDGDDEGIFVDASGNIGVGTSTPTSRLSVIGDLYLSGALRDGLNSAGTAGMVLQSTGASTRWVATSTLGFTGGGGGGATTFLALTDTPGSYTADRIMFTNSGATGLTDSASFVFDGTNLGIGTTTPSTALSVVGDTTLDGGLSVTDNVFINGTIQAPLLTPGRVLYSTTGSYLTDSANFTFDGTNLGVGTSTPSSRLSVVGDFYLTGALRDGLNASGTSGMVLQSTGTTTRWVATSTLGITGGGGSSLFTDGGAVTYLTDSADNLAIGTTTAGSKLTIEGDLRVNGNINFGAETIIDHYSNNLLFGSFALGNNVDGYRTIAIGDLAGNSFNTGFGNVYIGNDAAVNLSTSSGSVVIGDLAVGGKFGGTEASDLVIIGTRAGYNLESGGGQSVFLGTFAGENVTSGGGNIFLGYRAGDNITDGYGNIVIGYDLESQSASQFQTLNIGNLLFGTGIDGSGTTTSSGNIGIGTSTPVSKLSVIGDVSIGAGPYYSQSRPLKIYDDGNTGGARISVIGTTGVSNTPAIEFVLDGILSRRSMIRMTNEGSSDYGLDFLTTNSGTVASKAVLTGDGNFGIGTTTPSEELTVAGTIQSSDLFGGTTNLVTDANGNIIRETSDERLKENVTTIENALDTVLALRGVRYKWIDKKRFGDDFEIGFLAQEVDEVVPEVVQKGGDYWALNSKNLVAVVVEAIKEVWAKVLGHEERLDELEAENEALKARLESVERELDMEDEPDTSTPPAVVEDEPEETEFISDDSDTGEESAEEGAEESVEDEEQIDEITVEEPEPEEEVVEETEPDAEEEVVAEGE